MATITASEVKELRQATGQGMMDCKKALIESDGDMEKAKDWLRVHGQKIVDKLESRKTEEGLVAIKILDDGSAAAIVQLNCVTDFVARNDDFVALLAGLTDHVAAGGEGTANGSSEELRAAADPSKPGSTFDETIKDCVVRLQEKISVVRFERITGSEGAEGSFFQSYIHPPGRLGALVEFKIGKSETASNEAFIQATRQIAMHVTAAAPRYLTRDEVSESDMERERAIYREQGLAEGKPENIVEKIIKGKMAKFYSQVCLVDQQFVVDTEFSVGKFLTKIGKDVDDTISIVRYISYKVGG